MVIRDNKYSLIYKYLLISTALFYLINSSLCIFDITLDNVIYHLIYVTLLLVLYILLKKDYIILGLNFVVFLYLYMCQFGFVIAYSINKDYAVIRSAYSTRYLYMPEYITAIQLSFVAVIFFALAIGNSNMKRRSSLPIDEIQIPRHVENATFYSMSFLLILGTIGLTYMYYLTRGMDYSAFTKFASEVSWYRHLVVILSCLFVNVMVTCNKRHTIFCGIIYLLICLLYFAMGNRGEVLYSVLCCVGIYVIRYRKISLKLIALGILLVIFIPIIRDYRMTLSFSGISVDISKSIVETLSELGFQIAPTTYTIQLVNSGYNIVFGGTYLYGIIDFFIRRIPFVSGLSVMSVLNIKYIMPQKGLGFSQVAELYYNFSWIGIAVGFYFLSKFLLYIENVFLTTNSIYKKMFLSMFVVEIINLMRNSSGTLAVYVVYMLIIILIIKTTDAFLKGREK